VRCPVFPDKPGNNEDSGRFRKPLFQIWTPRSFEAGIFGEDMTEKPGKCEADNKKKSQNSGGEFWSV